MIPIGRCVWHLAAAAVLGALCTPTPAASTHPPIPRMKPVHASAAPGVRGTAGTGQITAPSATELEQVSAVCRRIGKKLSSVSAEECMARRLALSGAASVLRTPILVKEYPPKAPRVPRARVLLIGGIHGDEYSAVSVVFKWMKILDKHHSGLFHWKITPLMNPDGLLRRHSQRMNANGVDLNRNFPTPNWTEESQRYWIHKTGRNPRRFPGVVPMSEPESQWLVKEIEAFRPDAIIATHAPHGIVDFDGPPHGPRRLGPLGKRLLGTYPGSLGNFAGVGRRLPVVTVEFRSAGAMPAPGEVRKMWVDLIAWLMFRFPEAAPAGEMRADAGCPGATANCY